MQVGIGRPKLSAFLHHRVQYQEYLSYYSSHLGLLYWSSGYKVMQIGFINSRSCYDWETSNSECLEPDLWLPR